MSPKRLDLSPEQLAAIGRGQFVRVDLGGWVSFDDDVRARSVFVGKSRGKYVAFANRCRHYSVELDFAFGPDDELDVDGRRAVSRGTPLAIAPMDEDGVNLVCTWHGAVYRPSDGLCVVGPCDGEHLAAVTVEEDGGERVLQLPHPPAAVR